MGLINGSMGSVSSSLERTRLDKTMMFVGFLVYLYCYTSFELSSIAEALVI